MKIFKSFIILTSLVVAIPFQSCQDELSELPGSVIASENAIIDQRTAEIALNGVYYRFANGYTSDVPSVYWMDHELIGSHLAGTVESWNDDFETHSLTSNDGSLLP